MNIAKDILTTIETKENLVSELHKKLDTLTSAELKEATERAKLLSSDLSEVIEGKITEKAKIAYCDKVLKDQTENIRWLKNDVAKIKNEIELCNDKISAYKYLIRELEL